MTAICGVEHEGYVWLGGDSVVSWSPDDSTIIAPQPKIIERGPMIFGWAGDLGACTLAATALDPTDYKGGDPRHYAATELAPALRTLLRDNYMTDSTCDLLIGLGGQLLYVGSDNAVHGFHSGYGAIGSGSSVAMGALHALECVEPKQRLQIALDAAAAHCPSVAPPFHFLRGGQRSG